AKNYANMRRWVEYGAANFPNHLRTGGVGDHLAPTAGRGGPGAGGLNMTNIVDTAYYARSAWILSQAAALLGKPEDAAKYGTLSKSIVEAFDKAYVNPTDGTIAVASPQTAYVLALQFDLVPEQLRPMIARHLADDVDQRKHLTTGFVGVGLLNPTLTEIG